MSSNCAMYLREASCRERAAGLSQPDCPAVVSQFRAKYTLPAAGGCSEESLSFFLSLNVMSARSLSEGRPFLCLFRCLPKIKDTRSLLLSPSIPPSGSAWLLFCSSATTPGRRLFQARLRPPHRAQSSSTLARGQPQPQAPAAQPRALRRR